MGLILAVHMTKDDKENLEQGGSYSARDTQYPKDVADFCQTNHFPYSSRFVSIAVYADEIGKASLGHVYGSVVAILSNEVIVPDIVLTCDGDLQDVAQNGMYHIRKRNKTSKYIRSVYLPSGSPAERMQAIYSRAKDYPGNPYTEARILRPITLSDITQFC